MHPIAVIGALAVGFLSGLLSGAVGVGGAVLSTPGVRLLGGSPIVAVGTTLPAIIPSALVGTLNYFRARLINFRIVLMAAAPGVVASMAGAVTSEVVGGRLLMFVTAGLVAENSLRMMRDALRIKRSREGGTSDNTRPVSSISAGADAADQQVEISSEERVSSFDDIPKFRWWVVSLIGLGAGFVSGLLGIGGGIIMIPAFYRLLKMPVKQVVATSLAVVGILAVPGSITHAYLGHIDFAIAGLLALGVMPGAFLGSRFTVGSDEMVLRFAVAAVLALIASGYILGEIRSILAT